MVIEGTRSIPKAGRRDTHARELPSSIVAVNTPGKRCLASSVLKIYAIYIYTWNIYKVYVSFVKIPTISHGSIAHTYVGGMWRIYALELPLLALPPVATQDENNSSGDIFLLRSALRII